MKNWMVLVGFCVVFVTCATLVAMGKVDSSLMSAPLAGFLGWLAPSPKDAAE
jgi:hypothetical protein